MLTRGIVQHRREFDRQRAAYLQRVPHLRRAAPRRQGQHTAFSLILGIALSLGYGGVLEHTAYAQFQSGSSGSTAQFPGTAQPANPETSQQQPGSPIVVRRTIPARTMPSAPLVEQPTAAAPGAKLESNKIDANVRNEIIEHHSEQMKSDQRCIHRLEQRRRALRLQNHSGYRDPRQ